ncbi:hypothetical protein AWM68_02165 [Fictibacillus phosphorivorans]|uniref:Uncharacterized protein n=1 Tax=Fictibacillus phosphorivorans TaxID=1221500 RepID=A0A161TRR9_9BACL|nr:hypothetical protein [Fictibacillus phosphorivorans]KZE69091.1 hypothetical protein AWM68_02165 [Fictibacillus phosphorivorans]
MRNSNPHQLSDSEIDNEIEFLELELEDMLNEYDVEFPTEDEIMMTINAIRPHVPIKENKWIRALHSLVDITKHAYKEVFYMSSLFWTLNGLLFLIALSGILLSDINPYIMMMTLAPIPTITGLIEVIKSKNTGMAELEMSYKYSFQEILLSKMLVVGSFNLGLNVLLTASLALVSHELMVSKLLLYWLTPFTCVTALSLLLVTRFRKIYAVTVGIVIWLGISMAFAQPLMIKRMESAPVEIFVALIGVAAIVGLFQAAKIYKRGVTFEINHH